MMGTTVPRGCRSALRLPVKDKALVTAQPGENKLAEVCYDLRRQAVLFKSIAESSSGWPPKMLSSSSESVSTNACVWSTRVSDARCSQKSVDPPTALKQLEWWR